MMEGWTEIEFTKSILQNAIGRGNQINASEILESGKYPVIDQGKSFITGYTNEEEKLIKDGFPYIIFGDHTRCFKYVDFPFVVGADGTKVLSPNTEIFDPLFFFFQLLNLDIQNRGYNRHFKLLKEKILKLPPLPEQRKIAYVLSTVQKAIEQQDKLIKTTTELKKALMQKIFTVGFMMGGWSKIEFTKSILRNAIGRSNQINASEILENGKYPVIDQGKSFIAGYTNDEEKLIKDVFPYIIFGDHTRCFKYVDFPFVIGADGTKVISPNTELFDPLFFYFQLQSLDIQNRGYNRHFKLLKEKILKRPPFPEQRKIAYSLTTLDNKIEFHRKKKQTLSDLFKTLLHELMTGQRRVHEIDFENDKEELSMAAEPETKYNIGKL